MDGDGVDGVGWMGVGWKCRWARNVQMCTENWGGVDGGGMDGDGVDGDGVDGGGVDGVGWRGMRLGGSVDGPMRIDYVNYCKFALILYVVYGRVRVQTRGTRHMHNNYDVMPVPSLSFITAGNVLNM